MNPSEVPQNTSDPAASNAPGCGCETGQSSESNAGVAGSTTQKIKDATRQTVSQLRTSAADAASRVKEQAVGAVDQRKAEVADRIGAYGSAVHRSAESLEGEDPNIAWLTHQAADRLNGVAEYIRNRDFQQLKSDVEGVARRHPAAFFGGMFVAGLVLGNVLKATQRPRVSTNNQFTEEGYPQAENVPVADVPEQNPWPSEPRSESL
jgi:hypothetical protein